MSFRVLLTIRWPLQLYVLDHCNVGFPLSIIIPDHLLSPVENYWLNENVKGVFDDGGCKKQDYN